MVGTYLKWRNGKNHCLRNFIIELMPKYRTILADPPWPSEGIGKFKRHKSIKYTKTGVDFPVMSMEQILSMPVQDFAGRDCHLWLWSTNAFVHRAFHVMEAWGFKYMYMITAVKPSGVGAYFAVTTQQLLFGYSGKCFFHKARFRPTHFNYTPKRHCRKPDESYELIESISEEPRLELFARRQRSGWDVWGNEVRCDVKLDV